MKSILLASLLLLAFNLFGATAYKISEKDSLVGFEIIKFKIGSPVEGKFKNFDGGFVIDEKENVMSDVKVTIKIASIDTAMPKRDEHLLADDFFSEKKYPTMTFVSQGKSKLADTFLMKGKLTLKGVTKDVVLDVKRVAPLTFEATTTLNRLDYGVSWNSSLEKGQKVTVLGKIGTMVLDEEVKVKITIVATK